MIVGFALAMLVFAQSSAGAGAFAGARPPECGLTDGFKTANKWERAKEPNLQAYCTLLASGSAKLVNAAALAKDVPAIADQAEALLPGRAAPSVLKGRALLRLGQPAEALRAFEEARRRDDRAMDDPVALLGYARASARTGHLAEAAASYRAALPRTSSLTAPERGAASFEAGMVVMALGEEAIDDAIAMLRQARREAQDELRAASVLGLALALDRAGARDEAKAVLAERSWDGVKTILSDARVVQALADAGVAHESDAMLGMALEARDASAAREAWRRYAEARGSKASWAEHARAHENGARATRSRERDAKPPPSEPPLRAGAKPGGPR